MFMIIQEKENKLLKNLKYCCADGEQGKSHYFFIYVVEMV